MTGARERRMPCCETGDMRCATYCLTATTDRRHIRGGVPETTIVRTEASAATGLGVTDATALRARDDGFVPDATVLRAKWEPVNVTIIEQRAPMAACLAVQIEKR